MNGRLRALENLSGLSDLDVQNTSHVDSTCAKDGSGKDVDETDSVTSSENVMDINSRQQNQTLSSYRAAGVMNRPKRRSSSIQQKGPDKNSSNGHMEGDGGEVVFDDKAYRADKENQRDSKRCDEIGSRSQHEQRNKTTDEIMYVARKVNIKSQRGCRPPQYGRKMPTNNKDDMTDESVSGTSNTETSEFKKRGGSLMQQWPSQGSQNIRSYKKRKMTTENH